MRKVVFYGGKKFYKSVPKFVMALMGAILLLALAGFSSAVSVFAPNQPIVVIDAGHGGYDPGATNDGVYEKNLNLAVAKLLKEYLTKSGIRVVMTRENDKDFLPVGDLGGMTKKQVDLDSRIRFIHESKAQICVSIHVNSTTDSGMSGAETFFQEGKEEGKRLAQQIQEELRNTKTMKQRAAKASEFYLIDNTQIPTVIIELGYLSNTAERKMLQETGYQQQLAIAITKGISNFFALKD